MELGLGPVCSQRQQLLDLACVLFYVKVEFRKCYKYLEVQNARAGLEEA